MTDVVLPADDPSPRCPICGGETEAMLRPLVKGGEIVADLKEPREIRERVLDQVKMLEPTGE